MSVTGRRRRISRTSSVINWIGEYEARVNFSIVGELLNCYDVYCHDIYHIHNFSFISISLEDSEQLGFYSFLRNMFEIGLVSHPSDGCGETETGIK